MPLSFRSFEWGRLLEHSFLEHFWLDQFSVILGKFYTQDSRTPRLLEHFWVSILGASCSNKLFVGTVRPSHLNFQEKWPQTFHEKSSTFSTRDETKFFHSEALGVGGPKRYKTEDYVWGGGSQRVSSFPEGWG